MKKVFDQTVRDLKREVNKKVLKVPGIEQKVLDATSNEPWGPHGTLLADIAQATRNYHEYQMIMAIIWKRINDTGKNWRHVYKALTVLEYLVAHGSERVIDEIKEHAYQISTLSGFHYIDSNGRDQGNNVKKKSQSLVELVNDKERIIEVRQKAAANRDKFRSTPGAGMYRPGYGDRYDDDRYEGRYGSRDEDRNGYGRDRDYNYRDEERYGRYGEGDRYGRDYEDRYGRDGYRDDDYQGRRRSVDGGSSRSRSSDRDRDHGFDDDGQSSSRGLERKFSEQNIGAPPTYEDAVGESRSPAHSGRNGEATAASAPETSSPPAPRSASPPFAKAASPPAPTPASPPAPLSSSPSVSNTFNQTTTPFGSSISPMGQEADVDEFDPRGPISAGPSFVAAPTSSPVPTTSNSAEMDLLGSLSDSFSNPLAIMPVAPDTTTIEADYQANLSGSAFTATHSVPKAVDQSFEDPFGDSPFKAVPSTESNSDPLQSSAFAVPFQPNASPNAELSQAAATNAELGFGDSFSVSTYSTPSAYPTSTNSQFLPQELSNSNQETDILAGILPPSVPLSVVAPPAGFSAPMGQPAQPDAGVYGGLNAPAVSTMPMASSTGPQVSQFSAGTFYSQGGSPVPFPSNLIPQTPVGPATHFSNGSLLPQQGPAVPAVPQNVNHSTSGLSLQLNSGYYLPQQSSLATVASQVALQNPAGAAPQHSSGVLGGLVPQGSTNLAVTQVVPPSSAGPLTVAVQPTKDKFETKSTVWADTLSRGLVNLNISGPKTNPLADIGVDFDAINRKEKRMEKQATTPVTSTVTMGKAMGSGSGIGRAGAGALRAPQNPMMSPGMGMAMATAAGSGMGMGGYGGMNQPMGMGMGMGMGMNMGTNPGMAMNMGMGLGGQIRPSAGLAPGATMPGSYNPMMGSGGYTQQPYGGGYQ